MGINLKKLYESRLKEIDAQMKQCVYTKSWHKKVVLDQERKEILQKLAAYES
ncbi:MAG: hypothetical protein J6D47_19670 [Peptostreptococcaceae bacterium]|nr:hypothetical protein [Peptostreptococcaceae bacterium]